MQQAYLYQQYRIHDFTTGGSDVIDAHEGDFTLHNYGRGFIEVGRVMPSGRIFGVMPQDVPFDAEEVRRALRERDAEVERVTQVCVGDDVPTVSMTRSAAMVARESVRVCYRCGADLRDAPAFQDGSGWYCMDHADETRG